MAGYSNNRQLQEDELLAVESIYPDCLQRNIEGKDRLINGSIRIDLPKFPPFRFVSTECQVKFTVNYLTPITLGFVLPESYPGNGDGDCPEFQLQSIWLSSEWFTELTDLLRRIQIENRGLPILFLWIQAVIDELQLKFENSDGTVIDLDRIRGSRVPNPNADTDERIRQLVDYNEKAELEHFLSGYYDCQVCMESKSGYHCSYFTPCGHIFCVDCVAEYYRQLMRSTLISMFECLAEDCHSPASPLTIRRVLKEEERDKFDHQQLELAIGMMSDVVLCPRPNCQTPVILDSTAIGQAISENEPGQRPVEIIGRCAQCEFVFCTKCKRASHGFEPCRVALSALKQKKCADEGDRQILLYEDIERLAAVWETVDQAEKKRLAKPFGGIAYVHRFIEEAMADNWKEKNCKPCPNCTTKIEKNDGCNKMKCTKCGRFFCWMCGLSITGYEHFQDTTSPCYQQLFAGMVGNIGAADLEEG